MKTIKFFLMAFSLAAIMVSCNGNSEDEESAVAQDMTFSATLENFTDGPAVQFAPGDAITLFDRKANNKFSTTDAGQSAAFSGKAVASSPKFSALYPYDPNAARYSGKIPITIPTAQEAVEGGLASGSSFAIAYTEKGDQLAFRNVPALLKVTVSASDAVSAIEVTSNGGENIAGGVMVLPGDVITVGDGLTGSTKVTLSGSGMDGSYYIAVIPRTLASGYTIAFVNEDDGRYTVKVNDPVELKQGTVFNLGKFKDMEWVEKVNPNPTTLAQVSLLKVSFAKADFNVVSDGGFERLNDNINLNTSWRFHAKTTATTAHTGSKAVTTENPTPGVWFDAVLQTIPLRMRTDYVYSIYAKAGTAFDFTGVRPFPGGALQEIPGPSWAPKSDWTALSKEFNSASCYYGDVFAGLWGDAGAFFAVDDIKLIPKGYTASSMDPTTTSVVGNVKNNTFNEVTNVAKAVLFRNTDGKIAVAMSKVTVNGKTYDNAFALTDADDASKGVNISKFFKQGGALRPICSAGEGEISIVPNSGFALNGKLYIHYFAKATDIDANNWTAKYAGFLVSADGGKTWTKGTGTWNGGGCFVECSICEHDGYLYMVGNKAGRETTFWANMYVAKIDETKDFTDPAKWEYYNGTEWSTGDESVSTIPQCCLTVGDRSEPAVVYNAKFGRFMMIYRSGTHAGLVYRDSDVIEGFWSGEKQFTKDASNGVLYSPSVLGVDADGNVIMAATVLQ